MVWRSQRLSYTSQRPQSKPETVSISLLKMKLERFGCHGNAPKMPKLEAQFQGTTLTLHPTCPPLGRQFWSANKSTLPVAFTLWGIIGQQRTALRDSFLAAKRFKMTSAASASMAGGNST
jgi:hypothetical protein